MLADLVASLAPVATRSTLRLTAMATFLALGAEWAFIVAVLVLAYQLDGVVAVGLVGMARTAPAAALAPLLSGALDGVPRHVLLRLVHLTRAVIVGIVALAAIGEIPIGLLYALAAAEGMVAVLHRPTLMALVPGLSRNPAELVAANAGISVVEGVGVLIGPAVGGALIALAGAPPALGVPAVAFAGAFVLILGVRPASVRRQPSVGVLRRLGEGLRAVAGRSHLRLLFVLIAAQTFVRGALMVLLLEASVRLLGLGEGGVGYLSSAIGAGGLIGAIGAVAVLRGRGLGGSTWLGLALWGLPIVALGLLPTASAAFPLMAIVGLGNAIFDVAIFTLLQRTVPNVLRGRVLGLLEALIMLSIGLGSAVAPVLLLATDVRIALLLLGLLLPSLALVSARALHGAESAVIVPARQLSLLRGVPAFQLLPLTVLEQLAEDLEEVRFDAGSPIIVQGAAGDTFFILGSGRAVVDIDGRTVAAVGPGDAFGEVALMRDVPRTASVTALEPVLAHRLRRDAFLTAVGSEACSWQAAEEVVAGYLAEPPEPA
jgi:hypothetical protein